jgi:hypothetical protein
MKAPPTNFVKYKGPPKILARDEVATSQRDVICRVLFLMEGFPSTTTMVNIL